MEQTRLEVIAPSVEGLGICTGCQLVMAEAGMGRGMAEAALDEYPPEWQADVRRLSEWVYELARRYGDTIRIRVIDPQSPGGIIKGLRYRVRRYPTWIMGGKVRIVGWDRAALEAAIQRQRGEEVRRA